MKRSMVRYLSVLGLAGLAIYAIVTLRGPHGIPGLAEKQHQIQVLEEQNAALAREIEEKKDRIKRLRESETLQELEIRDRWKLVRPNEKVYVLPEAKKP